MNQNDKSGSAEHSPEPTDAALDDEDFRRERESLASNPQFLAIIERSRASYRLHGGLTVAEVRKELGIN